MTEITDMPPVLGDNCSSMRVRQPLRRAASLLLMLALVAWAQADPAVKSPAHAPRCRMAQSASPMKMACCPEHAKPAGLLVSLSSESRADLHRPECCTVRGEASKPLAFLVVSGKSYSPELKSGSSPGQVLLPGAALTLLSLASSPPSPKPVFEQKADLRI